MKHILVFFFIAGTFLSAQVSANWSSRGRNFQNTNFSNKTRTFVNGNRPSSNSNRWESSSSRNRNTLRGQRNNVRRNNRRNIGRRQTPRFISGNNMDIPVSGASFSVIDLEIGRITNEIETTPRPTYISRRLEIECSSYLPVFASNVVLAEVQRLRGQNMNINTVLKKTGKKCIANSLTFRRTYEVESEVEYSIYGTRYRGTFSGECVYRWTEHYFYSALNLESLPSRYLVPVLLGAGIQSASNPGSLLANYGGVVAPNQYNDAPKIESILKNNSCKGRFVGSLITN